MPRLHARSVPTVEYVDRSVAISIVSVPARDTDESRLALSVSTVRCPAGRAGLRGVGRIYFDQTPDFVGQHRLDLAPADVENDAVQPALLSDIAPRLFDSSGRTFGHVFGAQSLNDNRSVLPSDGCGGAVRPILADAGLPGAETGHAVLGDGLALTAALAPGNDPASRIDLLGKRADAFRQDIACAIGQHQRNGNAAINPDCTRRVNDTSVDLACDANLPAEIGARNGGLHDAAFDGPETAKLHPANLGQLHRALIAVEALHIDLATGKGKAVVDALLVRCRKASAPGKKVLERNIKSLDRHLLGGLADIADEVELGAQGGQLAGLRDVVEVVAGPILVSLPPVAALLKASVVNQTANPGMLTDQSGLRLCRFQFEGDAAIDHIKVIDTSYAGSQDAAIPPRPERRGFARRVR